MTQTKMALSTYLVLIELVQGLCLHFFQRIVSTRCDVQHLVNLGVLLAVAQQVHLLKVLLSEHAQAVYLTNLN